MKKTIIAALLACLPGLALAQTTNQFPTTPWKGFAPSTVQCGSLIGANFNVVTDQAIPIAIPSAKFVVDNITISNPSTSLTTAQGGFYSAAAKGGIAIVANSQAYSTLTTNAANATGNVMSATLATAGNTTAFNGRSQSSPVPSIYFALTTGQGAAATADIRIRCRPLY